MDVDVNVLVFLLTMTGEDKLPLPSVFGQTVIFLQEKGEIAAMRNDASSHKLFRVTTKY